MTEKRSLSFQRQSVEHILALCPDADPSIIDAAKQACLSLAWFERHAELTREIVRLEKEMPALSAVLHQMPMARIRNVRMYEDDNGESD